MRYALGLEYEGSAYNGLQKQASPKLNTIQETLEQAIAQVADHPIETYFAGRTDSGVHATGQVCHFDSDAQRSDYAWLCGINTNLPRNISVKWVKPVTDDFHARFSALSRRYNYWIYNQTTRPAILQNKVTWHLQPLNISAMQEAVQHLMGEHDFTSFRARSCQAHSPVRTIHELTITQYGSYIKVDICANAFLHHMVRNIVGILLMIGENKQQPDWVKKVLAAKDRRQADVTASSAGLYLVDVAYPEIFAIPSSDALCYNSSLIGFEEKA